MTTSPIKWCAAAAICLSCSSNQAQENCILSAQNAWRTEVVACAEEGLSAEECGLNEMTERWAENEKACIE